MSICSPLQSRISSAKSHYSFMDKHSRPGSILGDSSFRNRISAYSPPPERISRTKMCVSPSIQKKNGQSSPNLSLNGSGIHFRQQSANIGNVQIQVISAAKSNYSDNCCVVKPFYDSHNSCLSVRKIPLSQGGDEPKLGKAGTNNETESLLSAQSGKTSREKEAIDSRSAKKSHQTTLWEHVGKMGATGEIIHENYAKYSEILTKLLSRDNQGRRRLLHDFPEGVVLGLLNTSIVGTLKKIRLSNHNWRRMRSELVRRDSTYSGFVSNDEFIELLNGKNIWLTNNEEYSLLSYFDPDLSGYVSYNHFLRVIM